MPDVRPIDANALKSKMTVDALGGHKRIWVCGVIDDAQTVDAIPREKWNELKETIIEMRDSGGTATQNDVCKFLTNLMEILEKEGKNNGLN